VRPAAKVLVDRHVKARLRIVCALTQALRHTVRDLPLFEEKWLERKLLIWVLEAAR
jgi:hypothetical protein